MCFFPHSLLFFLLERITSFDLKFFSSHIYFYTFATCTVSLYNTEQRTCKLAYQFYCTQQYTFIYILQVTIFKLQFCFPSFLGRVPFLSCLSEQSLFYLSWPGQRKLSFQILLLSFLKISYGFSSAA